MCALQLPDVCTLRAFKCWVELDELEFLPSCVALDFFANFVPTLGHDLWKRDCRHIVLTKFCV